MAGGPSPKRADPALRTHLALQVSDYYKIPAVKQLLRMTMHICFMGLVSYASMEAKYRESDGRGGADGRVEWLDGHFGGGMEAPLTDAILLIWNVALAFDEWYKYALDKKSFTVCASARP